MLPYPIAPMLATMAEPFDSPDFTYEIKWDGYRCLAFLNGSTRLQSRNGKDFTSVFPELQTIRQRFLRPDSVLDGEIVALRNGMPSFLELQTRGQLRDTDQIRAAARSTPVVYLVFDLLYMEGKSLTDKPLAERRALLWENLHDAEETILTRFVETNGTAYFQTVSSMGLEGVVAKRKDSRYLSGKRVKSWLKFKAKRRGHFIVCGYTRNPTSRGDLRSLILGAYLGDALHYFGMVGTGFTQAELSGIEHELKPLAIPSSPFSKQSPPSKNIIWIQPRIVCEVEYLELTDEGSLRHPSFQRFRPDLKPPDCQFER